MIPLPLHLILPGLLAFGVPLPPPPAALQAIDVEACATQLRNPKGNLIFYLWRDTDPGFPDGERGRPFRKLMVRAELGKATFRDLPPGTYALSVIHDEKGTGTVDRNLLGLPRSGVGVSGEFSRPPAFAKSRFTATGNQSLSLIVHYLM